MPRNPDVGNEAPDLTLVDHEGADIRLSSLWLAKPLILTFARHFG